MDRLEYKHTDNSKHIDTAATIAQEYILVWETDWQKMKIVKAADRERDKRKDKLTKTRPNRHECCNRSWIYTRILYMRTKCDRLIDKKSEVLETERDLMERQTKR